MNPTRTAPGAVRLDDDTRLSSCLTNAEDGGQLADVGPAYVTAAQRLAASMRITRSNACGNWFSRVT